ncbi:DNA adenine methylase [Candidatus Avelusimicrobium fimicolum]|uniref:DNA adenine methylase n=1 Tax=Candidatus Avelusimicrobium fimicolum TaxID=3416216 RepID=UPI003D0CD8B5
MLQNPLFPIIKWAGGKEGELKYILPNLPAQFSRFIEPFVGGGAVYFSINTKYKLINDKSKDLINFYLHAQQKPTALAKQLQELQTIWKNLEKFLHINVTFFQKTYIEYKQGSITDLSLHSIITQFIEDKLHNCSFLLGKELYKKQEKFKEILLRTSTQKIKRMKCLEDKNGDLSKNDLFNNFEGILKASFYTLIRDLYNQHPLQNPHYFYFIREYCYSSMFRYNTKGEFNVPYGGISYNKKNFQRKIDYILTPALQKHLKHTQIYNMDFEKFLDLVSPKKDDFIFLDPPYDSDFNNYSNNTFDRKDQERLAQYLIYACPAKFMLIIKHTALIEKLYYRKGLYIHKFSKTYMVSFKGRNNREAEHLLITNYPLQIYSGIETIN